LKRVNDTIIAAVKQHTPGKVVVEDHRLVIDVINAEKENPGLVGAIFAAGGHIQFVQGLNPTLEDVYLKTVREE